MKKQITQQRIVSAIENIDRALQDNRKFKKYSAIVQSLALKGLQSSFGCFEFVWQRFHDGIDRFHKKREKVWEIQSINNISGLVFSAFDFSSGFQFPWVHENLRLQESDLIVLKEYKLKVIEHWFDFVAIQCSVIYLMKKSEWEPSTVQGVLAAAPFYCWANYYKCCDELHLVLGNGLDVESAKCDSISFCAVTPGVLPCR